MTREELHDLLKASYEDSISGKVAPELPIPDIYDLISRSDGFQGYKGDDSFYRLGQTSF